MRNECLASPERIAESSESTIEDALRDDPRSASFIVKELAIRMRTMTNLYNRKKSAEDHNVEWWRTYRAALSGARVPAQLARPVSEVAQIVHEVCRAAADQAHGPLKSTEDDT